MATLQETCCGPNEFWQIPDRPPHYGTNRHPSSLLEARPRGEANQVGGLALSQLDGIDQGVLATNMGAAFFQSVGFKQLAVAHVDGDDQDPAGFDLAVLKYSVLGAYR